MSTFSLHIQLLNLQGLALRNLAVELWITDGPATDHVRTDAAGNCVIQIDLSHYSNKSGGPVFGYLVIYDPQGNRIYGSADTTRYALEGTGLSVQLTIPFVPVAARRADSIPFRLADLRRPSGQMEGLSAAQQEYLTGKLNAALHTAARRALEQAGVRLQETPLELHYAAWQDRSLSEVLLERVLPVLNNIPDTRAAVEGLLGERLAQHPPLQVREILHLDQPLIKNPIFREEVQVLRTTELTDILLPGRRDLADKLLERSLDWERATAGQWDDLAGAEDLLPAEKAALQRGFALSRFTGGHLALVGALAPEMSDLSQIVVYDAEHLLGRIQALGGETPNGEAPEEYAANLVKLAQRNFPSAFLLHRQVWQPKPGEQPEQNHLRQFVVNNPKFDLRTANFFQKDAEGLPTLNYFGIPEEQQEGVRKQMMSFQRVMHLADSYEAQEALLEEGFDSAAALMSRTPKEVQDRLGGHLEPAVIQGILANAQSQMQQLTNAAVAIQNLGVANNFGFAVENYPDDLKNHLQDIDGYAEMFGSQDYCECEHCKSILGPAAYFVDLMRFVEDHVKFADAGANILPDNDRDKHPISLAMRRPDLWDLELSCENTNASIPYLQLINEIKQRYISKVLAAGGDVWEVFSDPTWKYSLRLAFNRPFEESQILLEHFDLRYADILKALRVQAQYRMDQAYLGLSDEDWRLVVTPDNNLADLRKMRFGFPADFPHENEPGYFELSKCSVPVFLRATGLSRADAEFLLSDKSHLRQISAAVKWVRKPQVTEGEIQGYKEWIEGLNSTQVLDYIHRFLRLQRHLPWTLRELDLVVQTLGSFVTAEIVRIARIREVQRLFNLSVEEAVALHQEIPNTSLYTRNVHDAFLNSMAEAPVPGMLSRMLAPVAPPARNPNNPLSTKFSDHKKWPEQLQRLSRCATEAAFGQMYLSLYGDDSLNVADISTAWRITRVANLLGLSLEEMGYLTELCDLPFWNMNAGRILIWKQALDDIKKMPLSLHEIWFIIRGEKTSRVDFAYLGDTLEESAKKLTAAYTKDERISINAEKILQEMLPKTLQDVAVTPFSDALVAGDLLKKISDDKYYVLKNAWFLGEDIPEYFPVRPGETPVRLAEKARNSIAERFNEERRRVQMEVFQEHLALLFKTGKKSLVAMLNWLPTHTAVYDEAESNYYASGPSAYATTKLEGVFPQLERLCLLFEKLGLDDQDASAWGAIPASDKPPFISRIALGTLPNGLNDVRIIDQVATYARFKKQIGDDEAAIHAYRVMMQAQPSTWAAAHTATFARALQCDVQEINNLAGALSAGLFSTDALRQMEDLVEIFGQLGIYASNVLNALKMNTYAQALEYETALRSAFRARYATEAAYEKAWEPYENRINEQRRDVLCAFLLALDQQNNFRDTGDLYAYFLVDVEMSGCARVSRILAATLSVQTYIHRVLMGLEVSTDGVRAGMDDESAKTQWAWRKNYRVWEANRKVFLYPENWIEPELRDDKSPLFKTLEDELLQQKVSLESAEAAYKEYLKGYLEIASLAIGGSYYDRDKKCYLLFGRTHTDPYQYHYRRFYHETGHWTPWEKIELAISAPYVGPIVYRKQIYIFWVDVVTTEKTKFENGNSKTLGQFSEVTLNYSVLNSNGKWLQPQRIKMGEEPIHKYWAFNDFSHSVIPNSSITNEERQKEFNRDYYFATKSYKKIYPLIINGEIHVQYLRESIQYAWKTNENSWNINSFRLYPAWLSYSLNTFTNKLKEELVWSITENKGIGALIRESGKKPKLYFQSDINNPARLNDAEIDLIADLKVRNRFLENQSGEGKAILDKMRTDRNTFFDQNVPSIIPANTSTTELEEDRKPALHVVHFSKTEGESSGDYIFEYDNQTYLIHRCPGTPGKAMTRISTSVSNDLIEQFVLGLEAFLHPETQKISEQPFSLEFGNNQLLKRTQESGEHLDFSGVHSLYFRELFFHIPFLVADHLNAEGKYPEADYWYRKIFDPSATYDPTIEAKDRYWQFLEFRSQTLPKLLEILSDPAAIAAYENDPFNPHAIARLRIGAYQKAIVMKYVDNLIDWGDSLFRRDTWESNTEAMMLYQLALDILGQRPQQTGPCESAIPTDNCGCSNPETTYAKLRAKDSSTFVYYIENWVYSVSQPTGGDLPGLGGAISGSGVLGYEDLVNGAQNMSGATRGSTKSTRPVLKAQTMPKPSFAANFGGQLFQRNAFCIPNNDRMLDYWDRVEDRLFKLRNCMNIDGVKRSLALFQPPIDPALLVAAFAAGLSVDDVLNSLYGETPAYRFTYLAERAKAYAGTVQGFGSALLAALEKKDGEQLTLLRSTHEQNILKMTKEIKKKAVEEARANLQGTLEGMVNVVNRVTQYQEWIEENLNEWERTQQVAIHTVSVLHGIEGVYDVVASLFSLIPQIGAPTAMTFGGVQLTSAAEKIAHFTHSLANVAGALASSAGLEASFQRRAQDWKFQLKLAEQEIKQVRQQIVSAQIRLAIAEKDLEIHEKQIEQAQELHDFYKDKFTNLGLYNYMASTLQRLHRMAFNAAMDMARQAEAAYKFETGEDDYTGISGGAFWDASRAGLLAGEQLSLEIQKMEANYMNWNRRQMEIRQSFSMRMLDPEKLLALQKDGTCTFVIPEWAFDMQYPGHYRRRIVSVQITIPCVAGPYTNIAATLTMTKGALRKDSIADSYTNKSEADGFTFRGSNLIATSNANNDGGQFELNFRDERFLPFEGAGAVNSEWVLELPTTVKMFDYSTISDVIFHISYRSKYDGVLKQSVENSLAATVNALNGGMGLKRLISLKQEFPDVYYQLQQTGTAKLVITDQLLPYFAKGGSIGDVDVHQPKHNNNTANKGADSEYTITLNAAPQEDVLLLVEYTL